MKPFNHVKSLMVGLSALAVALPLTGCGGDTDGPLSNLYGIYEVTTWNENEAACDSDGTSVLDEKIEKFLVVKEQEFIVRFVAAEGCETLEACREVVAEDAINLFGGYIFERGSDSDGWTGSSASASSSGGETCTGIFNQYILTSPESGVVELVKQTHEVTEVGRDSEDFCDTDEVTSRGPSEPCQSREVIRARFVEGI